jgi:hypothetical protein
MLPRPRIEKRRALHKPPFPGYVSIGLLQMILGHTSLDALLDMTTGEPVFPAFLKYDSHFEDEAANEHRIKHMLPRPRIEKRRAPQTALPRVCLDRAITNDFKSNIP